MDTESASGSSGLASASGFAVQVLGPFAVWRDGKPLDTGRWPRRSQTLLKLLAVAHQGRRLRDEVIDLLWPEAGPEAGGSNLRYVLHALRRDLGGGNPPPIASDREWISLSDQYMWDIDLLRFEELAGQANGNAEVMEQALSLCRGETLAEDRYEDWAMPVRERVDRLWRALGIRLSIEHRTRGEYEEAIRRSERLLDRDPLDEESMKELLLALEAAGRRADAMRRYREFERRVADELGVEPADDVRAVVARLADAGEPPTSPSVRPDGTRRSTPTGRFLGAVPTGPLVARKDELTRLSAVTTAVQEGSGRFILFAGEAGVGKTRLAQEAMVRLREQGFLVLTGRCSSRAQATPFHPLIEALSGAQTSAVPAGASRASEPSSRIERIFQGQGALSGNVLPVAREVRDLLAALAEHSPIALLVDDLHWADEASVDVLQYVAGSTRSSSVLLLATYREGGLDRDHRLLEAIRELDREGLVERLTVRRLTEEGTAALVTATVGEMDAADEFVEFVHRRTKGNPFYIDKMLQGLGGHYRLVRQIGVGGMGRVFEAVDTQTGDVVAAKIMFARTEADPKSLQRFEQEGAVLAALDHPNIVRVRGVFLEERASCIVMELLRGRSLEQLLHNEPLTLVRIRSLGRQVAAALVCAHERGIVHRDIKPDNIMVLEGDHVKVTDFGIARLLRPVDAVTTMTSTGMTMGTPLYMAPEQIQGKPVDGRTDIYALGCVLYQMVTGRPPFEGDDPLTVAIKHVADPPVPPREVRPDLPKDWERLILRALSKDPAERFPSADAIDEALDEVSDGIEPSGSRLDLAHSLPGRIVAGIAAIAVVLAIFAFRPGFSSTAETGALGRLVAAWNLPPASPASFKHPAALAIDRTGRFFVLDQSANRVVRLSQSGTPLGSWGELGSGRGQLRQPQALALDGAGNVYVADTGNDRIQKFSPAGRLLAIWGHTGSNLGEFRSPDGIAVDRTGLIYVADSGNNRVEVLRPNGRPLTTSVATFPALYAGLNRPAGIAVNSQGEAFVADNGDNSIIEYSPNVLTAFGNWTASGDPRGVALSANGDVYVSDGRQSVVERYSSSGTLLQTWHGGGAGVGTFSSPQGLATDSHGGVYVADSGNGRILKRSGSGQWVPAWGPRVPVQAPSAGALAVDARGMVYVADVANSRVLTLAPSGRWLESRALPRGFAGPIGGMALEPKGNLLVTDYDGNRVLRLSSAGSVLARLGFNPSGPGLTNPQGVAVDRAGAAYVADQGNSRIQKYGPDGGLQGVWSIATTSASEPYLYGVAVDRQGSIYTTDQLNSQILKLAPGGRILLHWGARGSGPGQLRAPEGLAVDTRAGRVYVADTGNNRIEVFSSAGKYIGSSSVRFVRPADVAVDNQGNVYVADSGMDRVEKFSP